MQDEVPHCAISSLTPAISNITRPGFTTATQYSGEPLPEPIRVSAGFFGYGLVGEYLYPDLTATLDVTGHSHTGGLYLVAGDPGGLHCNEAILAVSDRCCREWAAPFMRPRCTLLRFTLLGINIVICLLTLSFGLLPWVEHFALIDPNLYADTAVSGVCLGKAVFDVGTHGLKGNGTIVVAFAAGDFGAAKAACAQRS